MNERRISVGWLRLVGSLKFNVCMCVCVCVSVCDMATIHLKTDPEQDPCSNVLFSSES